jgi:hypothetical protein
MTFLPGPVPRVYVSGPNDIAIIRLFGIVGLSAEFNMTGNVVTGVVHVNRLVSMTEDQAQALREWGAQKLGVIPEQIQIGG